MNRHLPVAAALLLGAACTTGPEAPVSVHGVVLRGPTQPVCQAGESCEAPLQGGFSVHHQSITVARFTTDSTGRFTLSLIPGDYVVIPDAATPVLDPTHQSQPITVTPGGDSVTVVFDTGIR